ncbi:MAG: hypothetical protein EZS28_018761 [Streblomastix strix]|uniref:Uncharacterized protein n=1 Tax=Streblomastix strix TaxID=222440 RepID=A0A5J4VSZ6_9EUKA|nr:MAG: hypothetical protein EZS28_018761 [Streblomastix strix]
MSSDELEPNIRLILTTLQQSIAKIHDNNRRTLGNCIRESQFIILKKVKEEQIISMKIVPLWSGQICDIEIVNENVQSHMFGQSKWRMVRKKDFKNIKINPREQQI